ncbi:flagellar basal-body MS-ring/collar protein FliF [Chitinasiproducens palmae]|nr:flagellar basal-body MS-ring/collar protein FliF [Chitinasiproducens palmae]
MSTLPPATSAPAPREIDARAPIIARLRANRRLPLIVAAAAALAAIVVLILWGRAPDYKVLYSNLSDRDGGAIIAQLQQMNVPYQFSGNGGAILVPAESVHEARLRLASQGLPKGGSVGFELLDAQKFGISQFAEQVNYQRALEGELARTIESIASVQSARVHLAIPKPTVFVREQQKPSASIVLNLFAGRALGDAQVSAVVHMVASAVPGMSAKNVTVVDQNGDLLTAQQAGSGLDAGQLKYVQQIEQNTKQRIEAILSPLFGPGNAHAQVSADVDFSQSEQTAELFQPNPQPQAAVRSQQTSETRDIGMAPPGGVPGALSNEPQAAPSAPVTNAGPRGAAQGPGAATAASEAQTANGPSSTRRDATTNYEVDRTVRHIEQPMGGVKRLSAAVVVNYRQSVNAAGKTVATALTPEQLAQTEALVKEAMGFDPKRGDTVNVVNSAFSGNDAPVGDALPAWRQPENIALAKDAGKYALIGLLGLYLFFGVLRPSLKKLLKPPVPALEAPVAAPALANAEPLVATPVGVATDADETPALAGHDRNLQFAKQIAQQDPKVVATVVKSWISDER